MDVSNITVNSNNSVRIDAEGSIIYIDPFEIEGSPKDADYIFLTHDHYDHFSPDDIAKIVKKDTVFVYPAPMDDKFNKKGFEGNSFTVEPGNTYEVEGLCFETVAAYNKLKPFHPKKALWCGYIIDVSGSRIYIAGDTDVTDEAGEVSCDIALVLIGGFYTMNYKEAAELINRIKPKVAIPTHYGKVVGKVTYGEDFKKLVDDSIKVCLKLFN